MNFKHEENEMETLDAKFKGGLLGSMFDAFLIAVIIGELILIVGTWTRP